MFSGIASEHRVATIPCDSFNALGIDIAGLHHTCIFEISKSARDVVRLVSSCALFGDLCSLLPDGFRKYASNRSRSFDPLKRNIIDELISLFPGRRSYRC